MSGTDLATTEDRRTLEARAEALARPLAGAQTTEAVVELLAFARAGGEYAVDAASVVEVIRGAATTLVPLTPPAITGVVNHRGRIVAVVDLGRLLAGSPSEPSTTGYVVVVAAGDAAFGIQADAISGVVTLAERELRAPDELGPDQDVIVSGLTPGLAAIVDVPTLASDVRIRVDDAAD